MGEHNRTLYVWDTVDGFYFQAWCRFADKDEFTQAVIEKYGKDSAHMKAIEFLTEDWT